MTPLVKAYQDLLPIEPTPDGFYSWHKGFFMRFTGDSNNTTTTVKVPIATLSDEQEKAILNRFPTLKEDKRVKKFSLEADYLEYVFVKKAFGGKDQPAETIAFLGDEADWLSAQGVMPGCSRCGVEGVHEVSRLHDLYLPLCTNCQHEHREELKQTLTQDETGRNYLTGILGAILGAAIGAGLFFVVAYFTNRMFSVLAIIIGILAVWLYRTFKGKLTVAGGVLVGLVTTAVALIVFLVYVYALLRQSYNVTFGTFLNNLGPIMQVDGMMSDLIFYLLFVILSVGISMSGFIKDVKRRRMTMTELGIDQKDSDVV